MIPIELVGGPHDGQNVYINDYMLKYYVAVMDTCPPKVSSGSEEFLKLDKHVYTHRKGSKDEPLLYDYQGIK